MKCWSPPLLDISFRNARWTESSVWNTVEVLLLVNFLFAMMSGVKIEEKSKVSDGLFWLVNICSREGHVHVAAGGDITRTLLHRYRFKE